MKKTIFGLAFSKLRYHKSRTLLTGIAIMLTTMLLMAIGTCGIAMLDMNRQLALSQSNYHASFRLTQPQQLSILTKHINVESLDTIETFAQIVNGKMNGSLNFYKTIKDGIYFSNLELTEGHFPEKEDEICSAPAFFERVGANPVVGGKVTLSFRVNGKGDIQTKEFTISGLLAVREVSAEISDSRIAWGAYISDALRTQYEEAGLYAASPAAYIRFYGEDELSYDEMKSKINSTASDIGLDEEHTSINNPYLATMTDPGTETMLIVAAISLIVILFSTLVIYSIYYVGVITDIQEIGKLKALGASRRQIARLFFCQGGIVCAFAIPLGLLIGYFLPYFLFPIVIQAINRTALDPSFLAFLKTASHQLHMFSLPFLLLVVIAVLFTVWVSLLKPIRMAKKVSPVEAIRYQENSVNHKNRRGHLAVKVSTLTWANLSRNKRRTVVTILTMGLSCVLFICVSAVLSSTSTEDIARRSIEKGDFRISLEYSRHDTEYPENNLDQLVQKNYFSETFLQQLSSIEGVASIERDRGNILSSTDIPSAVYEDYHNRITLSYFTREDVPQLSAHLKAGTIDYDRMTAGNEILCTHIYSFDIYGLALGDVLPLTLYDGDREVPLTVTLTALTQPEDSYSYPLFIMTEDTWNSLGLTFDPTTDIFLHVKEAQYDSVKKALQDIVAENEHFRLYSLDEEMLIGRSSVSIVKYPIYLLLLLIAVIGFMNLINTMITSIITRKKELGILQALGLSNRQLVRMLAGEGIVFTFGTLLISLTLGNLLGYLLYLYAKEVHFMSLSRYHYPLWETIGLTLVLLAGQAAITLFISKKVEKESLIERIRSQE